MITVAALPLLTMRGDELFDRLGAQQRRVARAAR